MFYRDLECDEADLEEAEPTELNPQRCGSYLELEQKDRLTVQYTGAGTHENDVGSIQANFPAPSRRMVYYFEVSIRDAGKSGSIALGFSDSSFKTSKQPGWEPNSYGYHGDDGKACHNNLREAYAEPFSVNDVIGAGINYSSQTIFFTKNRKFLGTAFHNVKGEMFPTVGLHSPGERVEVNFGQKPFQFDIEGLIKEERERRQRAIEQIQLPPDITTSVVRSYLLFYGYKDTLEAFDSALQGGVPGSLMEPAAGGEGAHFGGLSHAQLGGALQEKTLGADRVEGTGLGLANGQGGVVAGRGGEVSVGGVGLAGEGAAGVGPSSGAHAAGQQGTGEAAAVLSEAGASTGAESTPMVTECSTPMEGPRAHVPASVRSSCGSGSPAGRGDTALAELGSAAATARVGAGAGAEGGAAGLVSPFLGVLLSSPLSSPLGLPGVAGDPLRCVPPSSHGIPLQHSGLGLSARLTASGLGRGSTAPAAASAAAAAETGGSGEEEQAQVSGLGSSNGRGDMVLTHNGTSGERRSPPTDADVKMEPSISAQCAAAAGLPGSGSGSAPGSRAGAGAEFGAKAGAGPSVGNGAVGGCESMECSGMGESVLYSSLHQRALIRKLIRQGDADGAMQKVFEWYPQVLQDDKWGVTFLLRASKFIELVKAGALDAAVRFARSELACFRGLSEHQDAALEECLALLAYEKPSESPLAFLLQPIQREAVADVVNQGILSVCMPRPPPPSPPPPPPPPFPLATDAAAPSSGIAPAHSGPALGSSTFPLSPFVPSCWPHHHMATSSDPTPAPPPVAPMRPALETLLRHLATCHWERRVQAGNQGEVFSLHRILRGTKDGGW